MEQTDNEITYQRRTIPPLSFNGVPSSSPGPEDTWGGGGMGKASGGKGEMEMMSPKELEKEQEAQAELQRDLHQMVSLVGENLSIANHFRRTSVR